ncbi:DUF2017 family protein [Microbacterium sp. ARD32]|uniref:DUF2017 family protein n=1 Tax=Microbacterium sp. ARD32 TaxID=2962577 RepID=UPI002880D858|nr:DUF2017 family protein [Microbacterium sp. ARD32]MDT0157097.1 DUF2017 family protein [Microbacterium sp. ARD32]
MTADGLPVDLADMEARYLLSVVEDFLDLLATDADAQDEALERLAPDPYPDDGAAAAECRRGTRDDLTARRVADAAVVRTALLGARPAADHGSGVTAVSLRIPRSELDSWLRTLAAIRLVLATRLGIDGTDAHAADDLRFGAYDWLGYRLELLVQLADRHDGV